MYTLLHVWGSVVCGATVLSYPMPIDTQPQVHSQLVASMLTWAFEWFHGGIEQPSTSLTPLQLGFSRR